MRKSKKVLEDHPSAGGGFGGSVPGAVPDRDAGEVVAERESQAAFKKLQAEQAAEKVVRP